VWLEQPGVPASGKKPNKGRLTPHGGPGAVAGQGKMLAQQSAGSMRAHPQRGSAHGQKLEDEDKDAAARSGTQETQEESGAVLSERWLQAAVCRCSWCHRHRRGPAFRPPARISSLGRPASTWTIGRRNTGRKPGTLLTKFLRRYPEDKRAGQVRAGTRRLPARTRKTRWKLGRTRDACGGG